MVGGSATAPGTIGEVSAALLQYLESATREHGVVVWYDPDGLGGPLLDHLAARLHVVRWRGSYWAARAEAERVFATMTDADVVSGRRRLLVHVAAKAPEPNENPLAELARAGADLDLPRWQVVALALRDRVPPPVLQQLSGQALSLAELDTMAASGTFTGGLLYAVAGVADEVALVTKFLRDKKFEERLVSRGLDGDLDGALKDALGFPAEPGESPDARRARLWRHVLYTELRARMTVPLTALESLPKLLDSQRDRCVAVCSRLRSELDFGEYKAWAQLAQGPLEAALAGVDEWRWLDTVPVLADNAFVRLDAACVDGETLEDVLSRARAGAQSFWARQSKAERQRWQAALRCAEMMQAAATAAAEVFTFQGPPEAWVTRYADPGSGWWTVDALQWRMEAALSGDDHGVPELVRKARTAYQEFAAHLAEAFGGSLRRHGYQFKDVLQQADVFHRFVEPNLGDERVAYILVDGLRYELGQELLHGLEEMPEVVEPQLQPAVATAPTVTEVGMAALLPHAERGLGLSWDGKRFGTVVDGLTLRRRADRKRFLGSLWGEQVVALDVAEIRSGRKWRERAATARLLVLWHRDIDEEGEHGQAGTDFKSIGDDIDKITAAVHRLREAGVTRVVIAADHGFLFLEPPPGPERTVAAPAGGLTWKLDRRCWVGQGGNDPDGTWRVPFSGLGLGGEGACLFPRGLGVFEAPQQKSYVHGGLSLQEVVIPVLTLRLQPARRPMKLSLWDSEAPGGAASGEGSSGPSAPSLEWGAHPITSRIVKVRVRWAGAPVSGSWRIEWVQGGAVAAATTLQLAQASEGEVILQLPYTLEGQGQAALRLVDQATGLTIAQASDVAYDFLV